MVLLVTIAFNCFFVLLWGIFFQRGIFSFSFAVILFLSLWDFLFLCETLTFPVRSFLSPWDFFFPRENFSTQSENFWSTIQERFGTLHSLCLALWAIPFYNLEKEQKGSGRLCSLSLACYCEQDLFMIQEYKDSLEKEKVYRGKLYHVSETFLSVH